MNALSSLLTITLWVSLISSVAMLTCTALLSMAKKELPPPQLVSLPLMLFLASGTVLIMSAVL